MSSPFVQVVNGVNAQMEVWDVGTLSWVKWTGVTIPSTASAGSPTSASVDVTSGQAIAANPSRKGLVFVNLSANTISFGIGQAAQLNKGISLTPNGVWEMDPFTFSTAAIFAIASMAGSALAIQELT